MLVFFMEKMALVMHQAWDTPLSSGPSCALCLHAVFYLGITVVIEGVAELPEDQWPAIQSEHAVQAMIRLCKEQMSPNGTGHREHLVKIATSLRDRADHEVHRHNHDEASQLITEARRIAQVCGARAPSMLPHSNRVREPLQCPSEHWA